ncbi:MAG: flagellar biosynthesis protein FliQ [Butyribacter sp.]|jgi:flagellar biosynthetic protein FliQ|uniref:Flagellar biosynthetic protein FliQ n=1 Tax=Butyribacter intestini TaxID=1703332 RepID=A0AAW3JXW2_9FIRM|nr:MULTISPECIES: flagellar biosynthesis protein FliQ [Clostridia]MBS5364237.1 flagellar biosynthesis protein FliQ [Clostridium sp.]MCQ5165067.1 flagellar biosynthesis protein FliQ [Roseburia hominis]OKZ79843.1 MAG: flagellar biosynthetic protein FliQ [Clostridium sp. CAG:12237_41]UYJ39900.1 MAG: flagellar biosynthesis protein FliQ [Lachnospiraceae bacterium]CCZ40954.1 putative uncharacterized protein [Clostridium sp. CAG:122]
MNEATIIDLSRETVLTIVETSMPLLLISLVIGLIISIFQTITSIQEQTLTFIPKFIAIMLVVVLCGNWIMNKCVTLFEALMANIPNYIK